LEVGIITSEAKAMKMGITVEEYEESIKEAKEEGFRRGMAHTVLWIAGADETIKGKNVQFILKTIKERDIDDLMLYGWVK